MAGCLGRQLSKLAARISELFLNAFNDTNCKNILPISFIPVENTPLIFTKFCEFMLQKMPKVQRSGFVELSRSLVYSRH